MKDENITYQGKIIEVVEQQVEVAPGKVVTFEKARRAPGTRLIILSGNGLLITKEFRHERGDYDYRLPGGKVFDSLTEYNEFLESGQDIVVPAKAKAKAEAREEVGVITDDITLFHVSVLGATVEWDLHYFVVGEHTRTEQELEEGEDAEVLEASRDEAKAMCMDGRISEERSALVLLRYLR